MNKDKKILKKLERKTKRILEELKHCKSLAHNFDFFELSRQFYQLNLKLVDIRVEIGSLLDEIEREERRKKGR